MRRALLMGAAAALFVSAGLAAQGRNFSGSWTIDSEKTAAAGGGAGVGGGGGGGAVMARSGGGGGGDRAIVAGGGGGGATMAAGGGGGARRSVSGGAPVIASGMTLALDANTFTITQGQTATTYHTDGSVTNLDNGTRKASAKAAWQGDKLVIETTTESPRGTMVSQAIWYLEGDSLVRENKSTTPDGQEIVRKTYFKRSTSH